MPVVEVERILWDWFVDSGLEASRSPLAAGQLLLKASNEEERWQITLRPRSALATEIQVLCAVNEQPDCQRLDQLWAYIAAYARNVSPAVKSYAQSTVPEAVLSKTEAVVCIGVDLEAGNIQLSGFAIDNKGLILATAHDLEGIKDIAVTLQDGRIFRGLLLKTDYRRDLALIDIRRKVNASVSLDGGRSALTEGERLFSINCAGNSGVNVHSAVVIGPPRAVHNLPLVQVSMETPLGSSGSPVFDPAGHFVAMVRGRYRGTDSVGFLTPLTTIREFLGKK
jgi:serine protease Do